MNKNDIVNRNTHILFSKDKFISFTFAEIITSLVYKETGRSAASGARSDLLQCCSLPVALSLSLSRLMSRFHVA